MNHPEKLESPSVAVQLADGHVRSVRAEMESDARRLRRYASILDDLRAGREAPALAMVAMADEPPVRAVLIALIQERCRH